MSASIRTPSDDQAIELGSAVNWPPILAAAGLSLAVAAVAVLYALTGRRAEPESGPAFAERKPVAVRYKPPQTREHVALSVPSATPRAAANSVAAEANPTVCDTPPPQAAYVVKEWAKVPTAPPAVAVYTPQPEPPRPAVEVAPSEPTFRRRHGYNQDMLLEQLVRDARELDIDAEKGTTARMLAEFSKSAPRARAENSRADGDKAQPPPKDPAILALVAGRADLKGLPLRNIADCQLSAKDAAAMLHLSTLIRLGPDSEGNPRRRRSSPSLDDDTNREMAMRHFLGEMAYHDRFRDDTSLRTLVQMLQVTNTSLRLPLVKALAGIPGKTATVALAQRAVFDLSPEVREAAVDALRSRPSEDFRAVLLGALRYPWAPAADHAAEALVALRDQGAVFALAALVDSPDPQTPVQTEDKKWVAPELVRLNHLGNCLLCHATSASAKDPVRAPVPDRGKPLPQVYYDDDRGNAVRADVTYLRQDFSVLQSVPDHGKWPALQRYDYLIRQRELTADEVERLTKTKDEAKPATYPQREAVLWALRELTGQDMGDTTADWVHGLLDNPMPFSP